MDTVDTRHDSQAARSSDFPGPQVFKAFFGGEPFRYPSAIEILSSHLLWAGYDSSRRLEGGGKLVTTARRSMHRRGSE